MSLSVDGFWKAGFWSTTFWADGFWREGAAPPVVLPCMFDGAIFDSAIFDVCEVTFVFDTHDGGYTEDYTEGYYRSWRRKDRSLRRQLEELFERAENPVREEIKEVVERHIDQRAIAGVARANTRIPIIWSSLRSDADAIKALLELYKQQAIAEAIDEEAAIETLLLL